jgi:uncharacterized membrane protein YcaP (DUF421 family)
MPADLSVVHEIAGGGEGGPGDNRLRRKHAMWNDMFTLGVPLLEKILRPILVYMFLVVVLRVFGKRELAQLNPFDLVVLLSLSNTVQNAIIGNDNSLSGGLIGAFALLAMNYLVVRFLFRHRRLDQILEGKPAVLIDQGKIVKDALSKELLTRSELMTVLHRQGFDTLAEVERCVLEPGGTFYIQRKTPPAESIQHTEMMAALKELKWKVDLILAQQQPRGTGEGPL